MQILNATPFPVALALGPGPDRQPMLAVVVKATFRLPDHTGAKAEAMPEQLPIATTHEYYDDDVTGSVRIESDLVAYKPFVDIVLVGTAYAPHRRPASFVDVSLSVGRLRKTIRVFGDRAWVFPSKVMMKPMITEPQPFVEMPLRYERAFGGIDHTGGAWCRQNLIGRGFIGMKAKESVHTKALPNLEDPRQLIRSWNDQPRPVGFGFFSQNWYPRLGYLGADDGLEPFDPIFGLPRSFRSEFYNGAHPDLQMRERLQGHERVELHHLTQDGYRRFLLPGVQPRITLSHADSPTERVRLGTMLDTVVFLPDENQFYMVWRGGWGLPSNLEDGIESIQSIHVETESRVS